MRTFETVRVIFSHKKPICEWSDIPLFSRYQVSTTGEIRKKSNSLILKQRKSSNGTSIALIRDDNTVKCFMINRLVLSTFQPHPNMKQLFAARKDGNRFNNHLYNLEWRSQSELSRCRKGEKRHGIPTILQKFDKDELMEVIECQSVSNAFEKVNQFFDEPIKKHDCTMKSCTHKVADPCEFSSKRCVLKNVGVANLDEHEVWKVYGVSKAKHSYYISNYGRVKTKYNVNKKERLLRQLLVNGYNTVQLCVDGNKKQFLVHRLVGELFVKNPQGYQYIDHIDGNPANNMATNMRFVATLRENIRNPVSLAKKINQTPILQIDFATNEGISEWKNAYTASKNLGLSSSNILACCRGKLKTCGGFKWKFQE